MLAAAWQAGSRSALRRLLLQEVPDLRLPGAEGFSAQAHQLLRRRAGLIGSAPVRHRRSAKQNVVAQVGETGGSKTP